MIRKLLALPLMLFTVASAAQQNHSTLLDVNHEQLVSTASLTYDKPVTRSEEGMPVGNGTMGSLVWTTPSAVRLQLNRVDVFANNSASNNFYERHTDYCSGVGFVDIDFLGQEIFTETDFRQHLSPYDGVATVEGGDIKATVLAWNEQDVMAMQVSDHRPQPQLRHIKLRMLRSSRVRKGNHSAISALKVIGNKIVLTQEFRRMTITAHLP